TCQPYKKIIIHFVTGIDDAHAGSIGFIISYKNIIGHGVGIPMPQYQAAFTFKKGIAGHFIVAAFYRDHFHFAVTAFEIVVMYHSVGKSERIPGNTYPDDLSAVGA